MKLASIWKGRTRKNVNWQSSDLVLKLSTIWCHYSLSLSSLSINSEITTPLMCLAIMYSKASPCVTLFLWQNRTKQNRTKGGNLTLISWTSSRFCGVWMEAVWHKGGILSLIQLLLAKFKSWKKLKVLIHLRFQNWRKMYIIMFDKQHIFNI